MAGCSWDTQQDKQGSTGRCPRDFLLISWETLTEKGNFPGRRPGVPGTPGRPVGFLKLCVCVCVFLVCLVCCIFLVMVQRVPRVWLLKRMWPSSWNLEILEISRDSRDPFIIGCAKGILAKGLWEVPGFPFAGAKELLKCPHCPGLRVSSQWWLLPRREGWSGRWGHFWSSFSTRKRKTRYLPKAP